ncbi:MAG: N-acetyl-alpha-D-glucosaminyl L-malate synthase BshA [Calditrichaeota bacterium]|nr:MAG: N-acetyl-alpha-D-glucosaminyl L-malate synthase BshA [Calditrichota bacterium]
MRIAISCYPTHGGSGVVASELALQLADAGHEVHIISYATPFRLREFHPNILMHEVEVAAYPLFKYPPYALGLATKMAEVAMDYKLDIIHAHYAVPHATSAYLARQILAPGRVKVITTLHGTDITLVGADKSFHRVIKFSIEQSDGVTAVSNYLRQRTCREFGIGKDIRVIHNFVDTRRGESPTTICKRSQYAPDGEFILMHASNFRPVKRVTDVVRIFHRVREAVPAKLLLVGEGPDRLLVQQVVNELGLREHVHFLGQADLIDDLLKCADVFLLPSEQESFGLAALEAMNCGVPVVGTQIGGVPEVVVHGETGFLFPVGEIAAMANATIELLQNPQTLGRFRQNARRRASEKFSLEVIMPQWMAFYEEVLAKG